MDGYTYSKKDQNTMRNLKIFFSLIQLAAHLVGSLSFLLKGGINTRNLWKKIFCLSVEWMNCFDRKNKKNMEVIGPKLIEIEYINLT